MEEFHHNLLQRTCRLCGNTSDNNLIRLTPNLRKILLQHNVHIDNEDHLIYPKTICIKCKTKVYASKTHIRKKCFKEIGAATFTKHDAHCKLCVVDAHPLEFVERHVVDAGVKDALVMTDTNAISGSPNKTTTDAPSPAALKIHEKKLKRFCRLCALPRVQFSGKSAGTLIDASIRYKLERITGTDLISDVDGVHPTALCKSCVNRIEHIPGRLNKQLKLGLPDFVAHRNTACYICCYALESSSPASKIEAGSVKRKLNFEGYEREIIMVDSVASDARNPRSKLPLHQCTADRELLNFFCCGGCKCIPLNPYITTCNHTLCSQCISHSKSYNVCPTTNCVSLLTPDNVSLLQNGIHKLMFECLKFFCTNNYKGCTFCSDIRRVIEHEDSCSLANIRIKKGIKRNNMTKVSLRNCRMSYLRQRIKPAIEFVDKYSKENGENPDEVTEALFLSSLHSRGQYLLADAIRNKAVDKYYDLKMLNPDECLARRVALRQTRTEYSKEYKMFMANGKNNVLQCPNAVKKAEMKYFPDSCTYTYANEGAVVTHNSTNILRLIDVQSGKFESPSWPQLRFVGYRWVYASALCATVQEILDLQSQPITTITGNPAIVLVKDGCDGLGDLKMWRDRNESCLPNKVIRYCFCVLEIYLESPTSEKLYIYKNKNPNAEASNRTLMTAIADENNKTSITTILSPILKEQKLVRESTLSITLASGDPFHFKVDVRMSMLDEKLDRCLSGLQSSSSSFLCTLCTAQREDWVENMGSYSINRTVEYNRETANRLSREDLNLSERQRRVNNLGIQCIPLRQTDPRDSGFDALHADINVTKVLRDVLISEIAAEIRTSKNTLESAETKLNADLKKITGLSLTVTGMNGPYVRCFLKYISDKHGTHLIENIERQQYVETVFALFMDLRMIYRSSSSFEGEEHTFKEKAVYFGQYLYTHFPDCSRTNYLHKLIEHCGEMLSRYPYSIGMFATDGLEAGNKIYRALRRGKTNNASERQAIQDVMIKTWLHTSPKLISLAKTITKKINCTKCKQAGHNARTCHQEDDRLMGVCSSDDFNDAMFCKL